MSATPDSTALAPEDLPAKPAGCPKCGSTGLHACPGHPVVWTQAGIDRLIMALSKYETKH
jgi:hypothetical protein